MRLSLLALLLCSPLAFAAPPSIDKVNGAIRTEPNTEYRDLETVNGSIVVAKGTLARDVETVNGSIEIREGAVVESAETVNGGISIEHKASVNGRAETVNGRISVERDAQVVGGLETVNGDMTLRGALVGGDLVTVNGDVLVDAGSIVSGGIRINKPNSFGWNWGTPKRPKVTIGANSQVKGTLHFEREVELVVHPTAKIGKVTGVAPLRSGTQAVER